MTTTAVVAAGLWAGLAPSSRDGTTPQVVDRASPSPSELGTSAPPRDAGEVRMRRIPVESRAELIREVAELGFDKVMVLSIGRPVKLEHYTTDHLHLRMTYETPTGEVRLFQSDELGITAGASVVIRGHEGVRNGEGASWVEGDYILDLNPLKRRYVRALRWVSTTKGRT